MQDSKLLVQQRLKNKKREVPVELELIGTQDSKLLVQQR